MKKRNVYILPIIVLISLYLFSIWVFGTFLVTGYRYYSSLMSRANLSPERLHLSAKVALYLTEPNRAIMDNIAIYCAIPLFLCLIYCWIRNMDIKSLAVLGYVFLLQFFIVAILCSFVLNGFSDVFIETGSSYWTAEQQDPLDSIVIFEKGGNEKVKRSTLREYGQDREISAKNQIPSSDTGLNNSSGD